MFDADEGSERAFHDREDLQRARAWLEHATAVGRLSPDYYCMDGTIPRAQVAEVLGRRPRGAIVGELAPMGDDD